MTMSSPSPPPRLKVMSRSGSRTSLITIVGTMPVIAEDELVPPLPSLPPRSPRRISRMSYQPYGPINGTSGGAGQHHPAPRPYSAPSSLSTGGMSFPDRKPGLAQKEGLREKPWLAMRGGWKRLAIIAFAVVVVLGVALGVGLALGLRKKNNNSSPDTNLPPSDLFPAGSFTFSTALTSVSTACTSNPSTWRCFPYTTHAQSPDSSSSAAFLWIIKPTSSFAYAVSSSDNPFAPRFADVPMTLLDGNQFNERYTFTFTVPRVVVPSAALDDSNGAATCSFPDTVFRATIWTRRAGELEGNGTEGGTVAPTAGGKTSGNFGRWPGRVEVTQVQRPGRGVPACLVRETTPVGDFALPGGQEACSCRYSNFDLSRRRKERRGEPAW